MSLAICDTCTGTGLDKQNDLLALVCDIHFPIGILGQMWFLIVSIPDLCPLSYLDCPTGRQMVIKNNVSSNFIRICRLLRGFSNAAYPLCVWCTQHKSFFPYFILLTIFVAYNHKPSIIIRDIMIALDKENVL